MLNCSYPELTTSDSLAVSIMQQGEKINEGYRKGHQITEAYESLPIYNSTKNNTNTDVTFGGAHCTVQ